MATDEIKERQKIQRFNLTNGGAVEVNGAESGNVYIEAFDEDNPLCGTVLEPTPAECDALIAAIGRALGRPAGGNAARIVNAIVADLSDRRGLRHEWDGIDDDIRAEIVAKWTRIVEDGMGAREQQ